MRGFGTEGSPLRTQRSRWLSEAARSSTSTSPGPATGIGRRPRTGAPPARRPRGSGSLSRAQSCHDSRRADPAGAELGLDAVGAAPAEPYEETERHIRERRERGPLRGDGLHDARGPRSRAIPETLLPGARTVISAALCYYAPERASPGRARAASPATRGPTATRSCARSSTRSAAGSAAPTACSSTRTTTSTARPRPAPASASTARTRSLITRRHGSWVVLGTLVTDRELEPSPPLDAGCGSCRLCIDACPTGALDEPGTLDSTRCLSYWTQAPAPIPGDVPGRARRLGLRLRHLPGRLPVEPRRREAAGGLQPPAAAEPVVSLVDWLEADGDELVARYDRLYVPRNDPRWLRRNALVAPATSAAPRARRACATYATGEDELLARARELGARTHRRAERRSEADPDPRRSSGSRSSPLALVEVLLDRDDFPTPATSTAAWPSLGVLRGGSRSSCCCSSYRWRGRLRYLAALGVVTDFAVISALMFVFAWEPGSRCGAAVPRRPRGGALLPAGRWPDRRPPRHCRRPARARALAGRRVRLPASATTRSSSACSWRRARRRRRPARGHGAEPGARRRGARGRGGAAARRARPSGRPARGDEPCRARTRLVARPRRGLRRVRPGAARPARRSTARRSCSRRRRRARDGDRRRRRRGLPRAGTRDQRAGVDPRGGDRGGTHDLPRGHRRGAVPRGGRPARARRARARRSRRCSWAPRSIGVLAISRTRARRRSARRRSTW